MIFYPYQMVNFALFCGEKRLKKGFGTAYCAFQAIKVVLLHFAYMLFIASYYFQPIYKSLFRKEGGVQFEYQLFYKMTTLSP